MTMSHLSHELRTSMTSYDDVKYFFTISRLHARQESPLSGKFSSTALVNNIPELHHFRRNERRQWKFIFEKRINLK